MLNIDEDEVLRGVIPSPLIETMVNVFGERAEHRLVVEPV